MKRILLIVLIALFPISAFAQSSFEIRAEIQSMDSVYAEDGTSGYRFEALGEDQAMYQVNTLDSYTPGEQYTLEVGQKVLLQVHESVDGDTTVFFVDIIRTSVLWLIFGCFAFIVALIGRSKGLYALVGLAFTIFMLFSVLLPNILAGANAVFITCLVSIAILFVNMHLAHGFSRSVFAAFVSAVIGLGSVVVLSHAFVYLAQLTGLGSEESVLLYLHTGQTLNPEGLLLAGIVLGAVGVLDDIAITQSETVQAIKATDPSISTKDVFARAMHVGQHHIASVVNTLVLAYAGVSLPLFLVFAMQPDLAIWQFMNEQIIAEEIVRTLAGTMGLVLLVPLSTWLAALLPVSKNTHKH